MAFPFRRRTFDEGYKAGIERTIAALEGTTSSNAYTGPVPEELKAWIEQLKAMIAS